MKKGSAFDEDGELIDVNKVQTALSSVGVSLLDAQGQFRDFDDVIFELADVWDSLDSASQRYIATIAAGNRQQSRFIALVSNADRLKEVSAAAENSEDAGLIQYAKTLESLESKQANLKTSFQQFYMDIFNGDFFKGAIDGLNGFLEGLNKLPKWKSLFDIASIISGVKMLGTILVNLFTSTFGQVRAQWQTTIENMGTRAATAAKQTGRQYADEMAKGTEERTTELESEGRSPTQTATGQGKEGATAAGKKQGLTLASKVGSGAVIAGGALSMVGASVSQKNLDTGNVVSGLGKGLSAGGNILMLLSSITSLAIGPLMGLAGAIAAIVAAISIFVSAPSAAEKAAEEAKKAREKADESNLKRAETAQEVSTLQSGIEKLKDLKKAQYDSAEAQEEYISANNSLAESFPELVSGFDEAGNAIIDVTEAELALAAARQRGAKEATAAAKDELEAAEEELNAERNKQYERWEAVKYDKSGTEAGINGPTNTGTLTTPILEENQINKLLQKQVDADINTLQGQRLKNAQISQGNGVFQISNIPKYIGQAAATIDPLGYGLDEKTTNWFLDHLGDTETELYENLITAVRQGQLLSGYGAKDSIITDLKEGLEDWKEVYRGQQEVAQKAVAVETGKKLLLSREISEYITNASVANDNQSAFDNLTNATLVANATYRRENEAHIEDEVEKGKTRNNVKDLDAKAQVAQTEAKFEQLQAALRKNGAVSDFNELTQSVASGKLTIEQYRAALTEMLGGENQLSLADEYFQTYKEEIDKANKDTKEALKNRDIADDAAGDLAEAVPQIYHEAIIGYAKTLSAQVEANKLTAKTLNTRMGALRDIWVAAAWTITDAALQGQVQSILGSTDFTSTFGKIEAINKLEDLGYTVDNSAVAGQIDKFDTGAENLITAYGELTNTLSDSLDSISDNLLNAADGFKLEDAQKIAKKTGLDISKDFTFINDKYYANSETAIARINEASLKNTQRQLDALKEKNQEEIETLLDNSDTNQETENFQQLQATYEDATRQWVDDLRKRAEKGLLTETEQGYIDKLDGFKGAGGKKDKVPLAKAIAVYLESLNSSMIAAGEQFIQNKLAEQSATRIDNLVQNIGDGLDSITSAVEGTLSALDLHELSQRYGLIEKSAISTVSGTKLGQQDLQTLIGALYNDAYEQFGVLGTGEFGKQLWDAIQASDEPLFAGYKDAQEAAQAAAEAAKDLENRTDAAAEAARNYAKAMQAVASAAKFDENSAEFAFMEQDPFKDLPQDNWKKFVSNIDTFKSSLQGLTSSQEMDVTDFFNIIDQIERVGKSGSFLASVGKTDFKDSGEAIRDWANKVVTASDEIGKVNAKGFMDVGIDISAAASGMAENMSAGLADIAQEQYNYLDGIEKMLLAFQSIEGIGDVELGLKIDFDDGTGQSITRSIATFQDLIKLWDEFGDQPNIWHEAYAAVITEINNQDSGEAKAGLDSIEEQIDQIGEAFNYGGEGLFKGLFGGSWETILKLPEDPGYDAAAVTKLFTGTKFFSQAVSLGQAGIEGMMLAFQDDLLSIGAIKQTKEGWKIVDGADELFLGYFNDLFSDPEKMTAALQKTANFEQYADMVSKAGGIDTFGGTATIDANTGIAYKVKLNPDSTVTFTGPNDEELSGDKISELVKSEDVQKQFNDTYQGSLASNEVYTLEFNAAGDIVPVVKTKYEKLIEDVAGGLTPADLPEGVTLKVSADGENLQMEFADGASETVREEAAAWVETNIGEAVSIDLNGKVKPLDVSSSEVSLAAIREQLRAITTLLTGQIDVVISNQDALKQIEEIAEAIEKIRTSAENIPITFSDKAATGTDEAKALLPGANDAQSVVSNIETSLSNAAESLKTLGTDASMSNFATSAEGAKTAAVEIKEALASINDSLTAIGNSAAISNFSEQLQTAGQKINVLNTLMSSIKETLAPSITPGMDIQGQGFNSLVASMQQPAASSFNDLVSFDEANIQTLKELYSVLSNIRSALEGINTANISDIGSVALDASEKARRMVDELAKAAKILGQINAEKFPISAAQNGSEDPLAEVRERARASWDEQLINAAARDKARDTAEEIGAFIQSVPEQIDVPITFEAITGRVLDILEQIAAQIAAIEGNHKISFTTSTAGAKMPVPGKVNNRVNSTSYTGNVFTTGPALVNGQMYGAAVAGKTLVGELGPELAVYDNQYHLLGEKGAEFVDLPSDAIVFNHLQTQGIINGKVDSIRGTQLKSAYNHAGTAYAAGNVGPAMAGGGISSALTAVRRAKSVWKNLLNSLSAADLLGEGGGGGGGGNKASSLKPYLADLQEWYNLSRQIVDLEKRINVLVAQRNNLSKGFDQGATYLRNLKESQALLEDELNTQRDLYRYQADELERQAKAINDSANWISKFYKVGADGVLQYVEGNETNGGKGALEVLQELNDMGNDPEHFTIKDQIDWIEKITNGQFERGFTWEAPQDENGNVTGAYTKKYWTDEEYVQEFFNALQEPIDDYDALRDTVQETQTKFEELREEIEKINDEIRDNEIEVAQSIHDAIIDVREKAIDDLEESNKLVQEANQKYANAINDAISREREQYNQNQSIAERETLQRQLSLLRRSGGSASEIQNLEKTISDKLKDEYFTNQENSLEAIKDANDKQTELMNQQVQIMKDSLEYEKENGAIWTKAYEIMAEGNAFMLDFLSGAGADSFLEKSNLEQEKMLEEWAFKIGLYSENERSGYLQNKYTDVAFAALKNTDWEAGYKDVYESMDAATRNDWDEDFLKTYNSYLLEHINGQSTVEEIEAAKTAANEKASQTFFEHIKQEKKRRDDNARAEEEAKNNPGGGGTAAGGVGGTSSSSKSAKTGYYYITAADGTKVGIRSNDAKSAAAHLNRIAQASSTKYETNLQGNTVVRGSGASNSIPKKYQRDNLVQHAVGGYNTTTGLAWLDGTPENPEYILNAAQTTGLEQLVKFTMRNPDFVDVLKAHYDSLAGNIAAQNYNTNNAQSIQIAEGAIQVNVAKLNDSYDINDISNDIMDRMYAIAAKSSSRSVKRR